VSESKGEQGTFDVDCCRLALSVPISQMFACCFCCADFGAGYIQAAPWGVRVPAPFGAERRTRQHPLSLVYCWCAAVLYIWSNFNAVACQYKKILFHSNISVLLLPDDRILKGVGVLLKTVSDMFCARQSGQSSSHSLLIAFGLPHFQGVPL